MNQHQEFLNAVVKYIKWCHTQESGVSDPSDSLILIEDAAKVLQEQCSEDQELAISALYDIIAQFEI